MAPDLNMALRLARDCQLAYPDAPHSGARPVDQIMASLPEYTVQGFEIGHNFAFAYQTAEYAVIVFQGSNDLGDWIANLDTVRIDHGNGKVHNGFYRCMQSLLPMVEDYCRSVQKPLYFTGHSLGAAIATLMALEVGREIEGVYLFGSPRVGDSTFAKNYAKKVKQTFRFENARDPVPRLPRTWWGFAEVGERVWFDKRGRMTLNAFFVTTLWNQLLLGTSIDSHRMRSYIESIVINKALIEDAIAESIKATFP